MYFSVSNQNRMIEGLRVKKVQRTCIDFFSMQSFRENKK